LGFARHFVHSAAFLVPNRRGGQLSHFLELCGPCFSSLQLHYCAAPKLDHPSDAEHTIKALERTDAERKFCGIRLRAEKRGGEMLKELARATPTEAVTIRHERDKGMVPATGGVSLYAQALTDNNISSGSASR
jgi:hypothetical protein